MSDYLGMPACASSVGFPKFPEVKGRGLRGSGSIPRRGVSATSTQQTGRPPIQVPSGNFKIHIPAAPTPLAALGFEGLIEIATLRSCNTGSLMNCRNHSETETCSGQCIRDRQRGSSCVPKLRARKVCHERLKVRSFQVHIVLIRHIFQLAS